MKEQIRGPKISVIVPVYNAEISLGRCVDSILHQTFKDFELILVDDGSKDSSGLICDSYLSDSRVRVIHKPNGGVSSARNIALETARGEYIAFCDADDEVLLTWLEDFICGIGGGDLCLQGFTTVDANDKNQCPRIPKSHIWNNIPEFLGYIMEIALFGFSPTKLFKGSIIRKHNLRFDETIRFREDDLFVSDYLKYASMCVSIAKSNYIYYLPAVDKNYGTDSTAVTHKLCLSILNVCNGHPAYDICKRQAWSIKGYVTSRLLQNGRLEKEEFQVFEEFIIKGLAPHSLKDKIFNRVISYGFCQPWIGRNLLKIIHRIAK